MGRRLLAVGQEEARKKELPYRRKELGGMAGMKEEGRRTV
jgi:hypothetical protein